MTNVISSYTNLMPREKVGETVQAFESKKEKFVRISVDQTFHFKQRLISK